MSGSIRRQLGPVRKRLTDRVLEVNDLLVSNDENTEVSLRSVRSKLASNVLFHEQLTDKLNGIDPVDENDAKVIEQSFEECMNLNVDVRETLQLLDDRIASIEMERVSTSVRSGLLVQQKLESELENLRLESELKKAKIEKLRSETGNNLINVKLPKLLLPTFSGNITEWPGFWDAFSSTIHNHVGLSKIDKFKYLMSSLEGEAKMSLSGFSITSDGYDNAISLLKEKYENVEFIIHKHYEDLSNIPKSGNEVNQLRKTLNAIEIHLRSLDSLGENIETKHLIALIKFKFPYEINLKLEELRDSDVVWRLSSLRKAINKLISARERSIENMDKGFDSSNCNMLDYAGEMLLNKDEKIRCVFRGLNHWADECQKYKTVQQRKNQLTGRCFVCLSSNHFFRECQSERACFYCKQKRVHHSSLCPRKFQDSNSDDQHNKLKQALHDNNKEVNLVEIGPNVKLDMDEQVIMKTAKIYVKNTKNGKVEMLTALLDTGAKHTYITSEKARKLSLEHGPSQLVMVITFASTIPNKMYSNRTVFGLRTVEGNYKQINGFANT